MGVGLAALKTVNIYCASFYLIRISGAENKLSRGGWVVGDCENKANSAQLGLAGALAELGKKMAFARRKNKLGLAVPSSGLDLA